MESHSSIRAYLLLCEIRLNLLTIMMNGLAFTQEELAELERAKSMPITFGENCPETTPERAMKFKRVNPVRRVAN